MSEWITDRLPTEEDCPHYGEVWLMLSGCPEVLRGHWSEVKLNNPWQPVQAPAPYVKPMRWTLEYAYNVERWYLYEYGNVVMRLHGIQNAEAAQRICDIYNEVLP
jgi:hypothetical protein